jgi:hypothetical protein
MKMLFLTLVAAFAIGGTARAQEPKAHDHEHMQPPAVADQKAGDEKAEHKDMKDMCMCCKKDGDTAMQEKMKDKMKDMKKMMEDKK